MNYHRRGWGLKSLLVAAWMSVLPTSQLLLINLAVGCHLLGENVAFLFDIGHLVGWLLSLLCCWGLDHLVLGPALSSEEFSSAL